jgi:hypothetical protein
MRSEIRSTIFKSESPNRIVHMGDQGSNGTNSMPPEPEGSSPYSQEPATGPYPEPTGSNLHSLRSILILSSHLRLGLPSVLR